MSRVLATEAEVWALSPDAASSKAAKGLQSLSKWPNTGSNDAAVWGECQGSGSKPYQTQVDLSGPAFKCSCPSRKFPCKHGLALMLLRAAGQVADGGEQPEWVNAWLGGRAEKAEKTLASGGPRSAPVAERLADFEKQVKQAQEAASAALLEVTKQVKALNDWWLEEMVQQPGYESGDAVPTPPEVVQLAQKMHDHIERTAASVGSLQRQMWENHGHDIQAARTYVMQPGVIPGQAGQAVVE